MKPPLNILTKQVKWNSDEKSPNPLFRGFSTELDDINVLTTAATGRLLIFTKSDNLFRKVVSNRCEKGVWQCDQILE